MSFQLELNQNVGSLAKFLSGVNVKFRDDMAVAWPRIDSILANGKTCLVVEAPATYKGRLSLQSEEVEFSFLEEDMLANVVVLFEGKQFEITVHRKDFQIVW